MWPDRVMNPGPLTYESGALPTALRSPTRSSGQNMLYLTCNMTPCVDLAPYWVSRAKDLGPVVQN